jgi:hypothetical protein
MGFRENTVINPLKIANAERKMKTYKANFCLYFNSVLCLLSCVYFSSSNGITNLSLP